MGRKEAIENMKEVLLQRREAIRQALKGDLSLLAELRNKASGDMVDAALDAAQDEINSQLAEVESRELANIENALEQMRQGSYGQCEHCGNSIPLPRLQALPYATTCIDCQRESEKNGRANGNLQNWGRVLDTSSGDHDSIIGDIELDVS